MQKRLEYLWPKEKDLIGIDPQKEVLKIARKTSTLSSRLRQYVQLKVAIPIILEEMEDKEMNKKKEF